MEKEDQLRFMLQTAGIDVVLDQSIPTERIQKLYDEAKARIKELTKKAKELLGEDGKKPREDVDSLELLEVMLETMNLMKRVGTYSAILKTRKEAAAILGKENAT